MVPTSSTGIQMGVARPFPSTRRTTSRQRSSGRSRRTSASLRSSSWAGREAAEQGDEADEARWEAERGMVVGPHPRAAATVFDPACSCASQLIASVRLTRNGAGGRMRAFRRVQTGETRWANGSTARPVLPRQAGLERSALPAPLNETPESLGFAPREGVVPTEAAGKPWLRTHLNGRVGQRSRQRRCGSCPVSRVGSHGRAGRASVMRLYGGSERQANKAMKLTRRGRSWGEPW